MPADITAGNPITPPGKTTGEPGPVEYVEVVTPDGQVVVTPFPVRHGVAVRARLAKLGLTGQDVRDAMAVAREASVTPQTKGKRAPEVVATSPRTPPPRAVLDTELVLSALVFRGGATRALRVAWQSRRFTPLASKATAGELRRALAGLRFDLTEGEQEGLLFEYLLFCEIVEVPTPPPSVPAGRDPFDVPSFALAVAGGANYLVAGDRELPDLRAGFPYPVVGADEFLARLEPA